MFRTPIIKKGGQEFPVHLFDFNNFCRFDDPYKSVSADRQAFDPFAEGLPL